MMRGWSQTARQPAATRSKWVRLPPASLIRPGQRRTLPRPQTRRSVACVPFMGSDRRSCQVRLAQWLEHRLWKLAVAGSTPVPRPQVPQTLAPSGPREAGQCVIGHRRASDRQRRGIRTVCPSGDSRRNRRKPGTRFAAGSTAECHAVRGYRFDWPKGKRQWMSGDLRRGLPRRRQARGKLLCRPRLRRCSNDTPHSERVIATGSAAQRLCLTRPKRDEDRRSRRPEGR